MMLPMFTQGKEQKIRSLCPVSPLDWNWWYWQTYSNLAARRVRATLDSPDCFHPDGKCRIKWPNSKYPSIVMKTKWMYAWRNQPCNDESNLWSKSSTRETSLTLGVKQRRQFEGQLAGYRTLMLTPPLPCIGFHEPVFVYLSGVVSPPLGIPHPFPIQAHQL